MATKTYNIGFEFEYFIKTITNNNIDFPSKLGLGYDEFPLIGEIRSTYNSSYGLVYGDFIEQWRTVLNKINKSKKYNLCLTGETNVDPVIYKKALERLGHKDITKSYNIYGYDANDYSAVRTNEVGKVISVVITAGLHIHFSCEVKMHTVFNCEKTKHETYETFPIINTVLMTELIKKLDTTFFNKYVSKESKYRQKGFYEPKAYGFEYRSLPANEDTLKDLPEILETSFDLFRDIYSLK